VEEIFETRTPKGEGVMSLAEGVIKEVDLEKGIIKIVSASKKSPKKAQEIIDYKIPADSEVYVKKGDVVGAGQPICQGSLDVRKLFKASGLSDTQRYIVKEVQRIYKGEGIDIHDKHIELIVRQMFSRMRITEAGDSPWVPGQIVGKAELGEMNLTLKKAKKRQAKALTIILGISRVALTSDSFLSAASFQETSRVLIKAALEGKEDKLQGLKENVIIGRLIPAGTGFRKPR